MTVDVGRRQEEPAGRSWQVTVDAGRRQEEPAEEGHQAGREPAEADLRRQSEE